MPYKLRTPQLGKLRMDLPPLQVRRGRARFQLLTLYEEHTKTETKTRWGSVRAGRIGSPAINQPLSPIRPDFFLIHPKPLLSFIGNQGEEYILHDELHGAEELYKTVVSSIVRSRWNARQRTALKRWEVWFEKWHPSPYVDPDLQDLSTALGLLSDMFLLGSFNRYELSLVHGLTEREHMVAFCVIEVNEEGRRYASICLDPKDRSAWEGVESYRAYLISNLLHEAVHGFLDLYCCQGLSCESDSCEEYDRLVGNLGHREAWLSIAHAMEKTAAKYLGFTPLIGLCGGMCAEHSDSRYLLRTAMRNRIFTSSQQRDPAYVEAMARMAEEKEREAAARRGRKRRQDEDGPSAKRARL